MSKPSNSKQPRSDQTTEDAPPPSYQASTSQPPVISHPAPNQPPHVHPQPFIHSRPSGNVVMYNYEGWTPPPNDQVARARARRRFFVALAWGFLIWVVLGGLIGGGAADMSQTRKHRHNGRLHTWTAEYPSNLDSGRASEGEAGMGWFGTR